MIGISYWIVPIFSGFVWLGTLLGMLLWWVVVKDSAHITPMNANQDIAYISDIGAHELQPLFIAGSTVTVVTFTLTFAAERWLRHRGRLVRNDNTAQKILSGFAIAFALIGMIGLIILSCLNDIDHSTAHDTCLVIFLAGYIISAIFICAEYQRLGMFHREHRHLRISFWIKLAFIFVELGLAIAFAVLRDKKTYNAAAYTEWVIAFIYSFYVWSFAIDFIPAVTHKNGFESRETEVEMATAMENESRDRGYPGGMEQEQNAYSNGNGNGIINGVNYNKPAPATPSSNF